MSNPYQAPKNNHFSQLRNRAGLYLRLSKDDGIGPESASIANQRKLLRTFASQQDLVIYREYADDGYSGTSFDRPGLQNMLRDIRTGKLDVVLVKDLSRLGRDSSRTTDLLDEFFPLHGIRFISVGEGFDSAQNTGASLAAPITNTVNELYARDISRKIRCALTAKMTQGEFIGNFAPFGYEKDPSNKNHLIPDDAAAEVVKSIFSMAAKGIPPKEIACRLNELAQPSPSVYRALKHPHLSFPSSGTLWTSGSVTKLLRNPCYLGHMVQGKTSKLSFKSKQVLQKPSQDFITVYNTHTPLISQEQWDAVRWHMTRRTYSCNQGFSNLFSGLAFCSHCGKSMSSVSTRRKNSPANLVCGAYKQRGVSACTNHTMDYTALCQAISLAFRHAIQPNEIQRQEIIQRAAALLWDNSTPPPWEKAHKRLLVAEQKLTRLYDDKYKGIIGREIYEPLARRYEAERQAAAREERQLRLSFQIDRTKHDMQAELNTLLQRLADPKQWNHVLLCALIQRVEIHQGSFSGQRPLRLKKQHITITLRFSVPMQLLTLDR